MESKCSAGLVNRQGVLSHNSREGYTAFLDNYQVALQKLFLFFEKFFQLPKDLLLAVVDELLRNACLS